MRPHEESNERRPEVARWASLAEKTTGSRLIPVRWRRLGAGQKAEDVGWGSVCSRMTQLAPEPRVGSKYPESPGAGLGNGHVEGKVRPI